MYAFNGDPFFFFSLQFLSAEEAPEVPPPVTDSATLKHFAREAEVFWALEVCWGFAERKSPLLLPHVNMFVSKNVFNNF